MTRLRSLPIGVKFGLLGVFLCASFASALFLCARAYAPIVDRSRDEAQAHAVEAAAAEASGQWTIYDDQLDIYAALIALRDPKQNKLAADAMGEALEARQAIDRHLAATERIAADSESRALVARIRNELADYDVYTRRMRRLAAAGDIPAAVSTQLVGNDAISKVTDASFDALRKRWSLRAENANAAVDAMAAAGARPMIPIGMVMLIFSAVVLTVVGRSISGPLRRLTIVAEKLAGGYGDLGDDLPASGHDEIGLLSGSFREMILKRRSVEEQLAYAAYHDALTGLANRALLMERLHRVVAKRYSGVHLWAILFLDLDRFKVINDSLGHNVGDLVLIEAARRLEGCLRAGDTLARLGGDEFIILLDGIADVLAACEVAERVLRQFDTAFTVADNDVFLGASVGIATSQNGDERPDDVLRYADLAMYHAKQLGRQRYELFRTELSTHAVALHEIETDLARALERQEFCLHYQPILSLADGRLTGFEALVRWRHPRRGLVAPDEFIGFAEENGSIVAIGEWILDEACRQLQSWRNKFHLGQELAMNVNVSAKQLAMPGFARTVAQALAASGLSGGLNVEITETVLVTDADAARSTLAQLRQLGVSVHLDDFGTGYSSLGYLHNFPIDVLKIDRSFVSGGLTPGENAGLASLEIVRTIVALARSLSLMVTAEGIETSAQCERLLDLGCTHGQGYYFSRPMDAWAAEAYIAASATGALAATNVAASGP
jgi:diguanylate cyclase (GGDEF)-like protein